MEQDGGGQEAGDQFSGVAVSVEEVGDGVRNFLQINSTLPIYTMLQKTIA